MSERQLTEQQEKNLFKILNGYAAMPNISNQPVVSLNREINNLSPLEAYEYGRNSGTIGFARSLLRFMNKKTPKQKAWNHEKNLLDIPEDLRYPITVRLVATLNELYAMDPDATQALFRNRVGVNATVTDSEYFQVGENHPVPGMSLGFIGLLNGFVTPSEGTLIFGIYEAGELKGFGYKEQEEVA